MEVLGGLNAYDWVVFTSPNGVSAFFDFFFQKFHDMRDIGGVRIAAVGPATAAKLRQLHLQVDLVPDEYLASRIADALAQYESIENLRILLLRAEAANPDLPKLLEDKGAIVDDIAGYRHGLAAAVNALLGDPELARTMGSAGRERAEREFSWSQAARLTVEIYRSVLAEKAFSR